MYSTLCQSIAALGVTACIAAFMADMKIKVMQKTTRIFLKTLNEDENKEKTKEQRKTNHPGKVYCLMKAVCDDVDE